MRLFGRQFFDRLRFRMAFSLAITLLPLTILSILQSQAAISQSAAHNEAALLEETVQMAAPEVVVVDQAQRMARALALLIPDLLEDPEKCKMVFAQIAAQGGFAFAGFVATDGHVPCASMVDPPSFAESAELQYALTNPRELVGSTPFNTASQTAIIYVLSPVWNAAGTVQGFVTLSIPQAVLLEGNSDQRMRGTDFLIMNNTADVLAATPPLVEAAVAVPTAGVPAAIFAEGGTFKANSVSGVQTIYAVHPIVRGKMAMIGLRPADKANAASFYFNRATYFPFLMWFASLIVGFLIVDFFIIRHVTSLGRAMGAFARTRQIDMPKTFDAAPVELREVGRAYQLLTEAVVRDDAVLEDALYQKHILLREVHHRVKNNLQLIASIMSMQMRRTESVEVKEVMAGLQDRVLTLATIHKSLYQTSGLASIRLDELLTDIVQQLLDLARGAKDIKITTDFDEVSLLPDQAVPFSLLVTEALTNAFKYISAEPGAPETITIRLCDLMNGRLSLTIENSRGGPDFKQSDPHSTGLGAQLMMAFASQLGTSMEVEATDTHYKLSMEFAAAPLRHDEEQGAMP